MLVKKRGRGRPRSEARQKERDERAAFQRYNDDLQRARERRTDIEHICFIGEITPQVDAATFFEALIACLRFLKAFRLPFAAGETLLQLEKKMYLEANRTKLMFLCPDGTLSELLPDDDKDVQPFDAVWIPVAGADAPISQEQLDAALLEITARGSKQF